jgi:hypothetical protein
MKPANPENNKPESGISVGRTLGTTVFVKNRGQYGTLKKCLHGAKSIQLDNIFYHVEFDDGTVEPFPSSDISP